MKIGLIDVDGHHFPNFALMRLSAWHKSRGDSVEWADALFGSGYDRIYKSKIFTFSPDESNPWECEVVKGGTGYDIKSRLAPEIEASTLMDYTLYPQYAYSIQFFSRGCIRRCPFCLVHDKEGGIHPVEPVQLNPDGQHIEVLDNNFFANPEWRSAIDYLLKASQKVNLHGVDVRIMDEEQAYWLNRLRLYKSIHIAWDLPQLDLRDRLKEMVKHVKPYKITCYVLIGFNSTIEQDLFRLNVLRELGITPFVIPFRDYGNERTPTRYERDLARWANRMWLFKSSSFENYMPRKGFKCGEYLK